MFLLTLYLLARLFIWTIKASFYLMVAIVLVGAALVVAAIFLVKWSILLGFQIRRLLDAYLTNRKSIV